MNLEFIFSMCSFHTVFKIHRPAVVITTVDFGVSDWAQGPLVSPWLHVFHVGNHQCKFLYLDRLVIQCHPVLWVRGLQWSHRPDYEFEFAYRYRSFRKRNYTHHKQRVWWYHNHDCGVRSQNPMLTRTQCIESQCSSPICCIALLFNTVVDARNTIEYLHCSIVDVLKWCMICKDLNHVEIGALVIVRPCFLWI